ncbi:MAG: 1A family penicillin-binding protein [Parcubacteria group bacterium Gr01-1014_33]|nr:MAG: 1A family penicillin-binding protein [Parcubacteria group bacterium Gr01-1014_33]
MRRLHPRKNTRARRTAVFFVLTVFFAVFFAGAWSAYSLVKNLPGPESITHRAVAESTKIYDRTGTVLLYEIHGEEKRTVVPLRDIPQEVRIAAIAAEDAHFYEHPGLDWRGVIRALITNIQSGAASQGGSTITQQLVKNSLLSAEKTYARKFKEAILAVLIERKYSKDEILELYLNQIPYGANSYGVAAAAQTYFGKPIQEITLAEAATLAVLPKAPTYYSPYGSHKDALLAQKDRILERVGALGLVSAEKVEQAKKSVLVFTPPHESIRAPHFVMYVREYINEKYGEDFVERGGLRVTTTLDWRLQEQAEKIIKEGAEKNEKLVQAYNAALVALDPKTGEIVSMVGSRDYFTKPRPEGCTAGATCKFDPHVNVTIRPRQPGSAFKPFVYATAFKKGYAPETVLFDAPTEFNPGCNSDGTPGPLIRDLKECYHPKNYDNTFRGPVSLRRALAQSLNVPSVELLYLAGIADSIQTAKDMGITTLADDPGRYGLALVLGGAEVTLLDMTSAFGAFAQEGILHQKTAVLRIENSQGQVLEETKNASAPALDTSVAQTINDVLSDNESRVPVFSRTSSLYFPDRQVAAKTGTTQDYRDAWTIGYTPSLVAGVWVGNSNNTAMNKAGLSVMVAAPLWRSFMDFAISSTPPESFSPPEKTLPEKSALRGMLCAGTPVRIDRISKKRATEYTPPELVEEVCQGETRSLLAFIKKDDPLGPPPADPFDDPQYKNWQESIIQWMNVHPAPIQALIEGEDDVHTPSKKPKITIDLAENEIATLSDVPANVTSFFPLREVSFFIDDELVESKTAPLLGGVMVFPVRDSLLPGTHQLRITAYDSVGNKEVAERVITIQPIAQ